MDGTERKDVRPGLTLDIVLKHDQRTGKLTRGVPISGVFTSTETANGIVLSRASSANANNVAFATSQAA